MIPLLAGACERIGKRPTMEDAVALVPQLSYKSIPLSEVPVPEQVRDESVTDNGEHLLGFFGVYDGHGGQASAKFVSKVLPYLLSQNPRRYAEPGAALSASYERCDELLRNHLQAEWADSQEYNSGCTAVSAFLDMHVSSGALTLTCANLGDSRCVLVTKDGFLALTEDHAPGLAREKKRIEELGGFVSASVRGQGGERVLGSLAVTRALGDFDFKMPRVTSWGTSANPITGDLVSAIPEVTTHHCEKGDVAVILACDGIWNIFTNEEAAAFVRKKLKTLETVRLDEGNECELVATALVEVALEKGSTDNCSCIVIKLPACFSKGSKACSIA
jgi:protein phosphatase 2C family protein 2/3